MTDKERKDLYLKRIRKILMLDNIFVFKRANLKEKLKEELKIIIWNNPEEWAKEFISKEVVPLLKRHGIKIKESL